MNTHEAIEALRLKAFETNAPSDCHAYYTTLSKAFQNGELVVRSTLPIAGEGKALEDLRLAAASIREWMPETLPADEQGKVHFARALAESAAEAIEAFLSQSEHLSALISSPGKDGGQEVEAAEWQRFVDGFGWQRVNEEDVQHYRDKGVNLRALYTEPPTASDAIRRAAEVISEAEKQGYVTYGEIKSRILSLSTQPASTALVEKGGSDD